MISISTICYTGITHTHKRAHTHIYTRTHTYTHIHTYKTHTYTYIHTAASTATLVKAVDDINLDDLPHTHTHIQTKARTHTCTRTHAHTYTSTHTNTHTYTHTHTAASAAALVQDVDDINLDDLLQQGREDAESVGGLQCVAVCCSVLHCFVVC